MYDFIVNFVGEVPEQFEFVYTILTISMGIAIIGTFTGIFYFGLRLIRGVV